jgi:hypothetical protein
VQLVSADVPLGEHVAHDLRPLGGAEGAQQLSRHFSRFAVCHPEGAERPKDLAGSTTVDCTARPACNLIPTPKALSGFSPVYVLILSGTDVYLEAVSITFNADDPRTIRALELASEAGQWIVCRARDGRQAFGVPSQSEAGRYYLVTVSSCDCPDFQHAGLAATASGDIGEQYACKHVLAVQLHAELIRAVHGEAMTASGRRRGHLRLVPQH